MLVGIGLLAAGSSVACRERNTPPAPSSSSSSSQPQPVGACRETPVSGHCRFVSVRASGTGSDGAVRYHVSYRFDELELDPDPDAGITVIRVAAAVSEQPALERHYRDHEHVRCTGVRIGPPCPPGVAVSAHVPAPPVGRVLRASDP
jgi:hypothetical protein